MKRRSFLKSLGAAGAASTVTPDTVFGSLAQAGQYFALHPFVAANPEAVFVVQTNVRSRIDMDAKLSAGQNLAQQLLVPADAGLPMSTKIALKPNLTCLNGSATIERIGVVTDPSFMEGWIAGLQSVGFTGDQIYMREGNLIRAGGCSGNQALDWYGPIAQNAGAHLTDFDSGRDMTSSGVSLENFEEGSEVIWRDLEDGVVFKRIGYLAPINAPDALNINISKFKAHGMGMTLCCKNWQGTNITPHVHYCSSVPNQLDDGVPSEHLNPAYRDELQAMYERQREAAVPRSDRPGNLDTWNSGPGMVTWSNKTVDNHLASRGGLHIIEGLYGRDGNWMSGPHDGSSKDFTTNVVIFGLNPFKVDAVGFWLAGHEPGNVCLFHVARERGLTDRLNPHAIPTYLWQEGQPELVDLDALERTPLVTYSMQRDYDGQDEPRWHLMNEPYEYDDPVTAVTEVAGTRPEAHVLGQNYPNPFNPNTTIQYTLPQGSDVRVEIYDSLGQLVDVLVDAWRPSGVHSVAWQGHRRASGTYYYRLLTPGFEQTRKMVLVR